MQRSRSALVLCAIVAVSPLFLASVAGAAESRPASDTAADGAPIAEPSRTALHLRVGAIDTAAGRTGLEKFVGAAAAEKGASDRFVIQLDGPMTPARRAALLDAGIVIGDYLPTSAFIVRLDRADPAKAAALGFVRWFDRYQDAWKRDPEVANRPFLTPERQQLAAAGQSRLTVVLFDGEPAAPVAKAIAAIKGATVHTTSLIDGNAELTVTINTADIPRLVAMNAVQYIEEAPEVTLRNDTTRWIVQSNVSGSTPLWANGLHGEGQVVGILDDKVDSNHCSFRDTANPIGPAHRKILAYNTSLGTGSHGTHVAGTAVGDNGDSSATRGIAYSGKLVYNAIPSFTEAAVLASLQQHHSQGARVHTNSWGNDGTTAYDALCRGFDVFQENNEDSFVCLAVTNGSSLKNPENAKNLLAVGNSQDTPSQGSHCTGGTGPTSDQRRKPEIYAPGCNTTSAASGTSCGTTQMTGTSMATPAIAGVAMLVRQYYADGYYPGGLPDPGAGFTPTSALIKATLLNSAVDMTGITGYPSNQEGWGRVLADDALYFPGDARRSIVQDVRHAEGLTTGNSVQIPVSVLSSGQPLKITLVWTEPPAAAGAAVASINDLDLVVTSSSGQTYLGNAFAGGQSATGGTRDSRNNVEQVQLLAPDAGPWTVQINATAVNSARAQGYAVVVSGDVQGAPTGLSVSLSGSPPVLVAANTPTMVDVRIATGVDTLIPGSATLHYRFAPGPFFSTPLQPVSGDIWRGRIPPSFCGESPQFYISAEGQTTGVRTAPFTAPASLFAFAVGQLDTTDAYQQTFAAGLPAGWTATGLWHATSACPVTPLCEAGPWMAYSQDATCNYSTGATNSGSLTSAPITLPTLVGGGTITLTYCNTVQTENNSSYDRREFYANATMVDSPPESATAWTTRTVDLTSYSGQDVTLRWFFNTVDSVQNGFRGWQVDQVRIVAQVLGCTAVCRADTDADSAVTPADVAMFITTWSASITAGTLDGDHDRNSLVNPADVAAFINDWFAALSGPCP